MKTAPISNLLFVMLSITTLTSCSSWLPQARPKETYILGASEEVFCETKVEKGIINLVSENGSPEFFLSNKIYYKAENELGSYQLAEWSESLPQRITRLIQEKLRCAGYKLASVSESESVGKKIEFSILEFSHQADNSPGSFKAVFRVKLLNDKGQHEKLFQYDQAVSIFDVIGVRAAADKTVNMLLNDIVDFTVQ